MKKDSKVTVPRSGSKHLPKGDSLAAVVVFVAATGFLVPTTQLDAASAMLPAAMLVSLMALSVALMVIHARQATVPVQEHEQDAAGRPSRVFAIFLMIGIYFVSVNLIGFYLGSALWVPVGAYTFGYRSPLGLAAATALVVGAIFLIFDVAMARELPVGLLHF